MKGRYNSTYSRHHLEFGILIMLIRETIEIRPKMRMNILIPYLTIEKLCSVNPAFISKVGLALASIRILLVL